MSLLMPCRLFPFLKPLIRRHSEFPIIGPRLLSTAFPGGSQSTIYALATGGVRCALAVIRVSGPCSGEMVRKIARYPEGKLPEPRKATLRKLYDPVSSKIIDHGIVIWFPGPKSFTGEDACEVHLHGSKAVITSMFEAMQGIGGCRMAEPGEFSKRAFLNGKMDLTAVEGLGDLISAETEMQRAQALNQMSGSLGSLYGSWRDRLAKCLANAEAFIDFGEDENIETDVLEQVGLEVGRLLEEMKSHVNDHHKGERLRNGVHIAILGRPNVGKSSLLNILTRRDAAIVSSIPGTTRDVVEACIDFKGYPIVFADTAGIRASPDEIEKEGIRRAVQEARKADIVLLVMSYENVSEIMGADNFKEHQISQVGVSTRRKSKEKEILKTELIQRELSELELLEDGNQRKKSSQEFLDKVLLVANKVDLASDTRTTAATPSTSSPGDRDVESRLGNMFDALISCKTHSGLEAFSQLLLTKVSEMCTDPQFESPCLSRERYRSHLRNCIQSLELYMDPEELNQQDLALRTHHLKNALNNIGYITGHVGTEDILDIIFRDFCIGK